MPKNNTPKNEWEYQYQREYNRIIKAVNRQQKLGYYIPPQILPLKPSQVKNITPEDVERLIELTPQKIRRNSVYIDTETGEAFEGLDIVKSHHKPSPSNAKIIESKTKNLNTTQQTKAKISQKKQSDSLTTKTTSKKNKTNKTPTTAPPKENNLNMQIIDLINDMINGWQPAPYWHASFLQRKTENYHKIKAIWEETLATEGEYEVAYRLENSASELTRLVERLLYSSDSTVEDDFNLSRFIELLFGRMLSATESDMYNEIARESAIESLRGENSVG